MNPLLTLAGALDELIPVIAIVFGCTVAMVAIVAGSVRNARKRRHREESRREIAAYVAEGSMSVETAERLMAAGEKPGESDF